MPVRLGGVIKAAGFTPDIAKKEWNKVRRAAGQDVAQYYFVHMLPIRFTTEGERKLGYAPRSKPYTKRKTREKGHRNPMVFSGESKQRALAQLNSKTIAAGTRFRIDITLHTPALNLRSPKQKVQPSDEIRRIAPDEEQTLNKVFAESVEKRLKRLTDNTTLVTQ